MNIFFCGDIMPGGVLPYQDSFISSDLLDYMKGFDFRVGTLESAIGSGLSYDRVKMSGRKNIIYARNEDFFRVKKMGFDVVSLANNHVWDLGEEGLRNTIRILDENNIKHCGAGINIIEASKPAVIKKDGLTVAILAYCMYGNPWLGYVELAKEGKAGVNPLDIDKVVGEIKSAKRLYDRVIVMPHWGREYQYEPVQECISMAKRMVEAGADAVLGSHTHQLQPLVCFKGVPICYSMGNFLFPDFYMYPPRPIWYPNYIEEIKGIRDVVGYPYPIEEPIRSVWNSVSRYGCTISLSVEEKGLTVDRRFVHLTGDNILSFSDLNRNITKELSKSFLILTCIPFRLLVKVIRKIRNAFNRLTDQYLGYVKRGGKSC